MLGRIKARIKGTGYFKAHPSLRISFIGGSVAWTDVLSSSNRLAIRVASMFLQKAVKDSSKIEASCPPTTVHRFVV
jgi:hypothetical protein